MSTEASMPGTACPAIVDSELSALSATSKQISLAHQHGKSLKVLSLVREARTLGVQLAPEDCVAALSCASKLAAGKNASAPILTFSDNFAPSSAPAIGINQPNKWGTLLDIYELSMDILGVLNEQNFRSKDAYFYAMKVCAEARSPRSAMNIMAEIDKQTDFGADDSIQTEYIKALCSAVDPNASVSDFQARKYFVFQGIKAYEKLKSHRVERGVKAADDSMYIAAAGAYSFLLGPNGTSSAANNLVAVLKDMMDDGFEPRIKMCRSILGMAVKFRESEVLL